MEEERKPHTSPIEQGYDKGSRIGLLIAAMGYLVVRALSWKTHRDSKLKKWDRWSW